MGELVSQMERELHQVFDEFHNGADDVADIAKRGFAFSTLTEGRKVMFVGLNPSYPEGGQPNRFPFDVQQAVVDYKRHFKKFNDLANLCDATDDWNYIDLLFLRETSQPKVMSLLSTPRGVDFICKQLQIAFNAIDTANPQLIVVCNRGAQTFFGYDKLETSSQTANIWAGFEFEFNEDLGVDVIKGIHKRSILSQKTLTPLIDVPVLFTSTLTYMDAASFKRMAWQMRQILKKNRLIQ